MRSLNAFWGAAFLMASLNCCRFYAYGVDRSMCLTELLFCSGSHDESTLPARVVLRSLQWHLAGSKAVLLMIQQAIFRNTAGIFPEQRKCLDAH